MRKITRRSFILALCLNLSLATSTIADERLFGHLYEADLLPKGASEFEQWVTQESGSASGVFSRWKVREELEHGFLDNFSGSIYLNWESSYTSVVDPVLGTVSTSETSFDGISTEWKWRLLNPYSSPVGLLLYFEPRYSGTELELENKVVLQSNLGENTVLAINLTDETEYAYAADSQDYHNHLELAAGLAYKLTPKFAIGAELLNSRVWAEAFRAEESSAWYAGPSFHYADEHWWATFDVLPQFYGQPETLPGDHRVLDSNDNSKVETRLILGINF